MKRQAPSEMTEEIEETFTDPDEAPTKRTRGVPRKPRAPSAATSTNTRTPRTNMRSRLTTSLNNVMRLTKWFIKDYFRQRCEVKARRDAKKCCRIRGYIQEETETKAMRGHRRNVNPKCLKTQRGLRYEHLLEREFAADAGASMHSRNRRRQESAEAPHHSCER